MAVKHGLTSHKVMALALSFLCAGATASVSSAQDFFNRYQPASSVSQVGYNRAACGGCTSCGSCDSCTPACGNNCSSGCCGNGCGSGVPSGMIAPPAGMDGDLTDPGMGDMADRDLTAPVAPPANLLASSFGASQGGYGAAPNVIGDFFGGGVNLGSAFAYDPSYGSGEHSEFAQAPLAAGDRLLKVVEFNSPIPTDRVFFTYNHFHNALQESIQGPGVVDRNLNRMTFGAEKTFNCGNSSIELRLPLVSALDATQNTSDAISEKAVLFGDLALNLKTILRRNYTTTYSAGLGITLPTAPDADSTFGGNRLIVDNEAVHLAPWLGMLHRPNDCVFMQGFMQFNFDLNGNSFQSSTGAEGVFQDQHLVFLSGSIGRWIYRDQCGCSYVTGIAPVLELHYSRTLNDADNDGANGSVLFANNGLNEIDVLNLTAGTHVQLGPMSMLTLGVVVPLLQDEGKLFDTEIAVHFNRRF